MTNKIIFNGFTEKEIVAIVDKFIKNQDSMGSFMLSQIDVKTCKKYAQLCNKDIKNFNNKVINSRNLHLSQCQALEYINKQLCNLQIIAQIRNNKYIYTPKWVKNNPLVNPNSNK